MQYSFRISGNQGYDSNRLRFPVEVSWIMCWAHWHVLVLIIFYIYVPWFDIFNGKQNNYWGRFVSPSFYSLNCLYLVWWRFLKSLKCTFVKHAETVLKYRAVFWFSSTCDLVLFYKPFYSHWFGNHWYLFLSHDVTREFLFAWGCFSADLCRFHYWNNNQVMYVLLWPLNHFLSLNLLQTCLRESETFHCRKAKQERMFLLSI